MAKAGRGQTRRDSKRRVLRPGESVRADENININIILMENHTLYTVGNWSLRTNFQRARSHASLFVNWKNR